MPAVMHLRTLYLLALAIPVFTVFAQQQVSRHLILPADTARVILEGTTLEGSPAPEERSTQLAILLSAVLPGAGQVYTERYMSIPIIWGFGVYFGKTMSDNDRSYRDYADRFSREVAADTLSAIQLNDVKRIRDFYRDQRDRFAVYLGITYLLNIVDAYVGAALYGFDVSPDLGGGAQIRYRLRIR